MTVTIPGGVSVLRYRECGVLSISVSQVTYNTIFELNSSL